MNIINMKNRKRGISPVIATVILISIVIILAVILFLWFQSFTKEAITKFDGQNIELVCEDVSFNPTYSSGVVYISNEGIVPIYEMNVKASGDGSSSEVEWNSGAWPEKGLSPGNVMSGEVNLLGFSEAKELILTPILIGTSETGQKTYMCDEKKYGKRIQI
jgi:flagellin-like protein